MMELSALIQKLPPDRLGQMQTLMHNMMGGYDVSKEMEEFEKSLPAGFREKLMAVMMGGSAGVTPPTNTTIPYEAAETPTLSPADMNLREARLTLLRAVSESKISPEEAEKLLFPS